MWVDAVDITDSECYRENQEVIMDQAAGTTIDNHTKAIHLQALSRYYFRCNNILQLLSFFCPSVAILLVSGHRISSALTGNILSNQVLYAALLLIVVGAVISAVHLSWNPLQHALRLDSEARRLELSPDQPSAC